MNQKKLWNARKRATPFALVINDNFNIHALFFALCRRKWLIFYNNYQEEWSDDIEGVFAKDFLHKNLFYNFLLQNFLQFSTFHFLRQILSLKGISRNRMTAIRIIMRDKLLVAAWEWDKCALKFFLMLLAILTMCLMSSFI